LIDIGILIDIIVLADASKVIKGNRRRVAGMGEEKRVQLNVRVTKETLEKLDEIVEYYQEHTKIGRVYKGDVLTDIIDKSYEVMNKQKKNSRKI
jgi:hypothetical protein